MLRNTKYLYFLHDFRKLTVWMILSFNVMCATDVFTELSVSVRELHLLNTVQI